MIELIYNEEEKYITREGKLTEPKNVKQMGEPKEYKKIFLEDYVHTFLMQYSQEPEVRTRIAVLFGTTEHAGGKRHFYVKSALPVEEILEKQGKYIFTEKIWGEIYQQCEKYFPEQEILGWFLAKPGFTVEKTSVIEETQRTYFSGADKIFFMLEPIEGDSGFFGFDGNRFVRQQGYYIYYDRNEPMHEFLLAKRSVQQEMKEKPDVAIANFRKILQEKQIQNKRRKKMMLSYGMRISLALLLCFGVITLQNQAEQMKNLKQQISVMTKEEVVKPVLSDGVVVEELPGNVETRLPVEETLEISAAEEPVEEEPAAEKTAAVEETSPAETVQEENMQEEEVVETVSTPETYVVQAGDTLAKISREQYGNDDMIDSICELNGIENGDYIQVGETILLP